MTYAEGGFNPAKDARRYKFTSPEPDWEYHFSAAPVIDWAERNRAILEETYRRLQNGGTDG